MVFGSILRPTAIFSVFGLLLLAHAGEVLAVPKEIDGRYPSRSEISFGSGSIREFIRGPEIYIVRTPKGVSEAKFSEQLLKTGQFSSVLPNTIEKPCSVPNDPLYGSQWHLIKISAERAWDLASEANTIVAVVDGGVDIAHEDLQGNLVPGYNTLTDLPQASGGDITDIRTNGHGTRIAGIIGARGNNGVGVCGVGWKLRIMPIRVTNDAPNGTALRSDLLEGVTWAVNNGAKVVNVSYTGVQNSDVEAAGAWARTQGANLVWSAADNGALSNNYDQPNVTIVGASDQNDNILAISERGRAVDVYAPGTQIQTIRKGGGYGLAPQGTSFAAPQVAGELALIRWLHPELTPTDAEFRLLRRSRDLGPLAYDYTFSWGRINVGASVEWPNRLYDFVDLTVNSPGSWSVYDMNDNGDIVGVSSSIGAFRYFPESGIAPLGSVDGVPIRNANAINMSRSIAGDDVNNQAYKIDANGTVTRYAYGPYGRNGSVILSLNNNGQAAGKQYVVGQWTQDDAMYWSSPSNPLAIGDSLWNEYTFPTVAFGLDDRGISCGRFYYFADPQYQAAWAYDGNTNQALDLPRYWWGACSAFSITETDWACGYSGINGTQYAMRWRLNPGPASAPGYQELAWSSMDSYATTINNDGDCVGTIAGQGYLFTGLDVGYLTNFLTAPLPQGWHITLLQEINNRGDLAGTYTRANGSQGAFAAYQHDDFHAQVNLGQIGENPTYIGSVPPVISVDFLNASGQSYGAPIQNLNYQGSTGAMRLLIPAQVTGDYRMRIQVNSNLIPSYQGCGYLAKIWPPMERPALPIDTHFVDAHELYQGDCDGDNEIGLSDFGILSTHFGMVDGEDNFDKHADIDGDGEVGLSDFGILSENFGLIGD